MGKKNRKRRPKKKTAPPLNNDNADSKSGDNGKKDVDETIKQKEKQESEEKEVPMHEGDGDKEDMGNSDDDESSSDEEDDDLVLEGMMCRVKGVESSSDDDDEGEKQEEEGSNEEEEDEKQPPSKKSKILNPADIKGAKNDAKTSPKKAKYEQKQKEKKSKKDDSGDEDGDLAEEPEIINVNFTFCDMNTKYYDGLKTLLSSANDPIHAAHSSNLSNLMIRNISVGTVLCIENDDDNNVYGFATVLSLKHYPNEECLHYLSKICLDHCPAERKKEMDVVLSGKTKRPCGFLIHARMVNIPLEITEVLHQQLVLDMDWAIKEYADEDDEDERKKYDYGIFVRMAPTYHGDNESLVYRYFDDEVFADRADFVYTFDAPKHGNDADVAGQEKKSCTVIVMTKAGHRDAMKDLAKMIHGK